MKTPELDKIQAIVEKSQAIGEFLEWLGSEKEIVLSEWTGSDCDECGEETLMNMTMSKEQLLADFFGIDLVAAEKERAAILEQIRKEN